MELRRSRSRLGKRRRRSNDTKTDYWSSLPNDILLLIYQKIGGSIEEYLRFGMVCRSWQSFATDSINRRGFGPLYVINDESKRITLRNPASDQTLTLELPEICAPRSRFWGSPFGQGQASEVNALGPLKSRLWGSPFGWLISFQCYHLDRFGFSLLNPFTGASIALPDYWTSDWANDSKEISGFLTANPESDPDNCLVVIVSGYLNQLAFIKPGGDWNYRRLPWNPEYRDKSDFYGVTYFKGNLYGIYRHNQVVCFQPDSRHGLADVTHLNGYGDVFPRYSIIRSRTYLVELDGQLCLCVRYYQYHKKPYSNNKWRSTNDFKFFVIDVSTGDLTPLGSLGDYCVFLDLDRNYSFSYKASYPPTSKLFERHHYTCDEFVSNYVFYNEIASGLQVWDMLHSCKVCIKNVPSSRSSSLWI